MPFKLVPLLRGFSEIKELYKLIDEIGDVFILGGYARYCASPLREPSKVGDIDLFSRDEKTYVKLILRLTEVENLVIKNQNENSISFNIPNEGKFSNCPQIQVIKPRVIARMITVGSIEEILNNFDFTVTRAAIIDENNVLVDIDFIKDEKKKKLRFKNIHCPVSSTLRCIKYSKKGYSLPLDEALKLFLDWDSRGEEYKDKIKLFTSKTIDYKEHVKKLENSGLNPDQIKENIDENGIGLSQEEIDEMEKMMLVD